MENFLVRAIQHQEVLEEEEIPKTWKRKQQQKEAEDHKAWRSSTRRLWKLRTTRKLQWKLVSPFRLLINFHEAYVEMMIRVANSMGTLNNKGWLEETRRLRKRRDIHSVLRRGSNRYQVGYGNLQRAIANFSVTFSIISVITGLTTLYSSGLTYGGPVTMVYGWPIVGLLTMVVGL
ncbi:hypothetical protein GH714_018406 [Hevea brasiliensis]|uniref:Uncharacterized protein n=1 Tax=Hevea brasiliensis TaxID=3981 RepID=A0A6A6MEJ3_HEVBR|nr:hypothetical protein GH714_018406 [Hevea brasiliensis]